MITQLLSIHFGLGMIAGALIVWATTCAWFYARGRCDQARRDRRTFNREKFRQPHHT